MKLQNFPMKHILSDLFFFYTATIWKLNGTAMHSYKAISLFKDPCRGLHLSAPWLGTGPGVPEKKPPIQVGDQALRNKRAQLSWISRTWGRVQCSLSQVCKDEDLQQEKLKVRAADFAWLHLEGKQLFWIRVIPPQSTAFLYSLLLQLPRTQNQKAEKPKRDLSCRYSRP